MYIQCGRDDRVGASVAVRGPGRLLVGSCFLLSLHLISHACPVPVESLFCEKTVFLKHEASQQ